MALAQQGAEGERLGRRPVEALAALEHLAARVDDPRQRLVDREVGGDGGEDLADLARPSLPTTPVATLRRSVIASCGRLRPAQAPSNQSALLGR